MNVQTRERYIGGLVHLGIYFLYDFERCVSYHVFRGQLLLGSGKFCLHVRQPLVVGDPVSLVNLLQTFQARLKL